MYCTGSTTCFLQFSGSLIFWWFLAYLDIYFGSTWLICFRSLKRPNCNPHKASPDPTPAGVQAYTPPWPPVQGLPTRLTLAHKHTQADWQRAGIGTTMPHSCVIRLRMRRWERFKKGRSWIKGIKGGDLVGMNREIVWEKKKSCKRFWVLQCSVMKDK